jgi:hypothetical protein
MLAGKYQGQVTLTGRPELEHGMPVYIPVRNMIYYVETIDHAFTMGSQFQTTLHLAYGHKPWEFLPEVLTFSANDEVFITDGHRFNEMNMTGAKPQVSSLVSPEQAAFDAGLTSNGTPASQVAAILRKLTLSDTKFGGGAAKDSTAVRVPYSMQEISKERYIPTAADITKLMLTSSNTK